MKKLCTTLHSVFYSTFQPNYYFGLVSSVFFQFGSVYIVATLLISCSSSSSGNGPLPTPADNVAPTAVIKPHLSQAIYRGDNINFSASNSYDSDSDAPLTYKWTIPGGTPELSTSEISEAVVFNTVGTYTITLSVSDNLNLESATEYIFVTVSERSQINNVSPIATIIPAITQTITPGSSLYFNGEESIDPDESSSDSKLSYQWTFEGGDPNESNESNPGEVVYNNLGRFMAILQVTDDLGKSSLPTVTTINVSDSSIGNQSPNGEIRDPVLGINNTVHVLEGGSINYNGAVVDPNGDSMTYEWTFDGGSPSDSNRLDPGNVVYESTGIYTSTLEVTDSYENNDPTPAEITIVVDPVVPKGNSAFISIVVMNDLHAHLTPHDDLQRNPDGSARAVKNRGGLARIATKIKQIRSENPYNLLLNIGDTFHGGVEAFYSLGNDIVEPVDALGIDVGVPGNWDFAYGPNVTQLRFGESSPFIFPEIQILRPSYDNLAANVKMMFGPRAGQTLTEYEYVVKEIAGVRIGIIGITSDIVPEMSPVLATRMGFLQGEAAYVALIERLANTLRNGSPEADIVVVMSELGIQKDQQLANVIFPGSVDIFFSAHTHELTTTPLTSLSGAILVEAGNDTYLGRMDIQIDLNSMQKRYDWRILPIDIATPEDLTMKALVQSTREKYLTRSVNIADPSPASNQTLTLPIDTVLTTATHLLSRRHSLENSFNNLVTDLIKNPNIGTGTQIVVIPGFRFDATIPGTGDIYEDLTMASGDITVEDIFRYFPAAYNLATATVTGSVLKQVIEANLSKVYSTDAFVQSGGWTDGYAGLDIQVDLSKSDGNRVSSLRLSNTGTPIDMFDNTRIYTITACTRPFESRSISFCTNGTGFNNVTPLFNGSTRITAADFLINQLKYNIDLSSYPARQNIKDSNATPLWPLSEFIQPINGVP